jgi:serine/threonine protein kinase
MVGDGWGWGLGEMRERTSGEHWIGAALGPYRIERLLEESALGRLFAAQHETTQGAYLVRILNVPEARTAELQRTYVTQVERYATHLTTLQHPAILPLVDFGLEQGLPYLVWPQLVMRPLSVRLAQSGPPDVITVGRYLDQIAAALEFAYQQATVHRNLSVDCIFLQLDGHVLVADFGVRRLVELLGPPDQRYPFYGSIEACAPEQIRGERVDAYTDVYALGGVVYRLLTGQPVFTGDSLDEVLECHLYEQPMPLASWRDDLPPGLEGILAGALAKDPAHRFPHSSAFANAYHEVVTPNNKTRVPLATGAPAVVSVAQPLARVASLAPAPTNGANGAWPRSASMPPGPTYDPPYSPLPDAGSYSPDGRLLNSRRSLPPWRGGRRVSRGRIALAAIMLLVLVGSGLFVVYGGAIIRGSGVTTTGVVVFVDGSNGPPGHTDALQIVLHGLSAPSSGSRYYAWLINQQSEHIIPLGPLSATDKTGQSYSLTYSHGQASGTAGPNLLGLGDKIEVTLEQGNVAAPVGHVVLMGVFPPQAFVHIRHLLVSFPTTPGQIGLLVGVLEQTQELDAQATALQNAAASGKTTAVRCIAQSILDIIEGTRGAHYHSLGDGCAALNVTLTGDGFGLLGTAPGDNTSGYLDGTTDHASLAATQPDATNGIRLHASHVEIAMTNVKGWVSQADQEALTMLATPTDAAALSGLVLACDHAYHGRVTNPDQTINPVPGEAGAQTAYEHGQFMATLSLVATS